MNKWVKYILIFGFIGAVVGGILGPIIIEANLECPVHEITGMPTECMGDPY